MLKTKTLLLFGSNEIRAEIGVVFTFNVNKHCILHFYYRAHNSYVRVSLPPSFSCPCSFSVKGGFGGGWNLTVQSLNLGTSLISLST